MYQHWQSVKEVIRHVLFRCGLSGTLDLLRERRGFKTGHMRQQNLTEIFSRIYESGAWMIHRAQDSLSGSGSTEIATAGLVDQLSGFLKDVDCRRLVDIGCGDFNWMRKVEGSFDYVGIDVVPQLIGANNARYARKGRRFACHDATQDAIEGGDVAICREVLFHLSFRDGLRLLRNVKAAGFKYVLLTHDKSIWFNSDIRNGDFRMLNLSKSPFRLQSPERELIDDKVSTGRVLAVWPATAHRIDASYRPTK